MILTGARIKEIGEVMYGPNWCPCLARDLGVSDRTMRNYRSGKRNLPADLRHRLCAIIVQRIVMLNGLQAVYCETMARAVPEYGTQNAA